MNVESVIERFRRWQTTRVLAFGSSNTERRVSGMHWFDGFELAVVQTHGRMIRCVNTGVGGNTTRELLARFEDDAAFYRPHLAFVTIGGNDANPERAMDAAEFERNLRDIHRRFDALGCAVVFQTYYAPDPAQVGAAHLAAFRENMETVRRTAAACGADLIDHLRRWEPFRRAHPAVYAGLMIDGFHVSARGNLVMALDIARHFGLQLGADDPGFWREAREIHRLMDARASAA
jgi:lysophospholipase L1-like esterase